VLIADAMAQNPGPREESTARRVSTPARSGEQMRHRWCLTSSSLEMPGSRHDPKGTVSHEHAQRLGLVDLVGVIVVDLDLQQRFWGQLLGVHGAHFGPNFECVRSLP
jgi:hypothetical protein